jgi:hypothetical protein
MKIMLPLVANNLAAGEAANGDNHGEKREEEKRCEEVKGRGEERRGEDQRGEIKRRRKIAKRPNRGSKRWLIGRCEGMKSLLSGVECSGRVVEGLAWFGCLEYRESRAERSRSRTQQTIKTKDDS